MGRTHTAIAGHVRAAHALVRIAAASPSQAIARCGACCARASARRTRAIARCALYPLLGVRASHRSLCASNCSLRAIDAGRSARGTRACARCARGSARCGAARLLPTRDCLGLPFAHAHLFIARGPRHKAGLLPCARAPCLAHCIRAARATSSLARRRMPALYNTP